MNCIVSELVFLRVCMCSLHDT